MFLTHEQIPLEFNINSEAQEILRLPANTVAIPCPKTVDRGLKFSGIVNCTSFPLKIAKTMTVSSI